MFAPVIKQAADRPVSWHLAATAAAVGWFVWIKGKLDASYAASNHPVDYATGQTTFDGQAVKGFYKHMEDAGTLDVYRTTQMIDFGFILGIFLVGLMLGALLWRMARPRSWAAKTALVAGSAAMLGALCDSIENLISFAMLANPQGFADWIALPYSGFAAAKFGLITVAMLSVVITLVLIGVGRLFRAPRLG